MQVFQFGCAPMAFQQGFSRSVTLETGTQGDIYEKYQHRDVAVVHGVQLLDSEEIEFAILERAPVQQT